MAIYRGAGGARDATSDAASEALLIRELAAEVVIDAAAAEAAKEAAEAAQAAAELAETNAETAEANAETAETNAETAQAAAASSASAASTSATNAAASASTATTQASNASTSASAASTSASSASTSATNAASSASAASTSATNAANSATSASTSASTATTQATNASNSATAAATSATNAANSATSASGSATSATSSASTATTQAGIATTKASEAAASAAAAATSETNAASSASSASSSASSATTSASNAATSASAADASAVSAAASAAAAASAYDNFDDRYLGAKSSDPALDNDGNALVTGALYYNTVDGVMKVYDGGVWIAASAASQAILTVYQYTATSGQTTFTGSDNNSLTLGYTVGSVLVTLNGVVLEIPSEVTASSGTSVVLASAAAAGDELNVYAFATFELADVYTKSASDARYPLKSNNLSDLASASSARTNLGLGTLATVSPTGTASSSTYLRGDSSWAEIQAGFTGGTNVTSATDVTLTAASTQVQRVNITTSGKKVILPNATTCTKGGVIFSIVNTGSQNFTIVDSTGFALGTLGPALAVAYFLTDNSTAAGKWATTTLESPFTFSIPDSTAAQSAEYIVALTDTSGVYVRNAGGGVVQARAYTLSGLTFTWGTATTIFTGTSAAPMCILKLTDTTFSVVGVSYSATNRASIFTVACSVSGTTITAGSSINIRAAVSNGQYYAFEYAVRVSSTVLVVFTNMYNFNTGLYNMYYDSVSISGTTSSVVSSSTWFNDLRYFQFAETTNDGATVVFGTDFPNNTTSYVGVLTLSGATITGYAETTSGTRFNNVGNMYSYSPSANTVFAVPTNGATKGVRVVTSGTSATITVAEYGSSGAVYMGYQNKYITQGYRVGIIGDYNSVAAIQINYSPNLGYANVGSNISSSCNNIPTASGFLASTASGATGNIIFVKGWL
jgi:multidrug efflux pump subunit AcrA (membrane-fusion protein)